VIICFEHLCEEKAARDSSVCGMAWQQKERAEGGEGCLEIVTCCQICWPGHWHEVEGPRGRGRRQLVERYQRQQIEWAPVLAAEGLKGLMAEICRCCSYRLWLYAPVPVWGASGCFDA